MNLRYVVAATLFTLILGASTFSYKDANNWGRYYSKCNGEFQSPMAMDKTPKDGDFPSIKEKLKFTDIHKLSEKMTIKNACHTVEMKADWSGKPPRRTGGPLHGNYVFEKTIFHWAQKKWTENINYQPRDKDRISYDMEMHLYFYKGESKSFEKAQSQKDGLAVFKVWFQVSNESQDPEIKSQPFFEDLQKIIHKVHSINSTAEIKSFPLASFLDIESRGLFLFYKGSLDYPPCSESVTWFKPESFVPIFGNLLNGFRKIKLDGGDVSNVRPLQPANKRQV